MIFIFVQHCKAQRHLVVIDAVTDAVTLHQFPDRVIGLRYDKIDPLNNIPISIQPGAKQRVLLTWDIPFRETGQSYSSLSSSPINASCLVGRITIIHSQSQSST